MEKRTDADMETVLNVVDGTPSATPTDLARVFGWTFGSKAEPNVNRVKRNLARLLKDKLVRETMGKWRATEAGQRELNAIDAAKAAAPKPMFPTPPTLGYRSKGSAAPQRQNIANGISRRAGTL